MRYFMISILFLLLSSTLFADQMKWILLKNGQRIEGKILKDTGPSFLISTQNGKAVVFISKLDVAEIQTPLETKKDFLKKAYEALEQNDFEKALITIELGRQIYKKDEELTILYARTLQATDAIDKAKLVLKNALILSRKSARLHFEMALLLKANSEYSKALKHFKRVRGLVPFSELDQISKQEIETLVVILRNPANLSFAQERAFYDPDLGNCHDASMVAIKLKEMFNKLSKGKEIKLHLKVKASKGALNHYEKGGDLILFRTQIQYVQLNLLIEKIDWQLKAEDYKLFMHSALNFLHELYPNGMKVSILTDGKKRFLEGIYAHHRNEPILKVRVK